MTSQFQREVEREVSKMPGVVSCDIAPRGKHAKMTVGFVGGGKYSTPLATTPSDPPYALNQVKRGVAEAFWAFPQLLEGQDGKPDGFQQYQNPNWDYVPEEAVEEPNSPSPPVEEPPPPVSIKFKATISVTRHGKHLPLTHLVFGEDGRAAFQSLGVDRFYCLWDPEGKSVTISGTRPESGWERTRRCSQLLHPNHTETIWTLIFRATPAVPLCGVTEVEVEGDGKIFLLGAPAAPDPSRYPQHYDTTAPTEAKIQVDRAHEVLVARARAYLQDQESLKGHAMAMEDMRRQLAEIAGTVEKFSEQLASEKKALEEAGLELKDGHWVHTITEVVA